MEHQVNRDKKKERQAVYVSPSGDMVEVTESNAPTVEGPLPTRDKPPLSLEQLRALAMFSQWRAALNELPAAPDEALGGPMRPTANEYQQYVLQEFGSRRRMNTNGDKGAKGCDGTCWSQITVDKDWIITAAQPGGRQVTLTAYNSLGPDADATRTTPPLNVPMLKKVTLASNWNNKHFYQFADGVDPQGG